MAQRRASAPICSPLRIASREKIWQPNSGQSREAPSGRLRTDADAMVTALSGYRVLKAVGRDHGLETLRRELGDRRLPRIRGRFPRLPPRHKPEAHDSGDPSKPRQRGFFFWPWLAVMPPTQEQLPAGARSYFLRARRHFSPSTQPFSACTQTRRSERAAISARVQIKHSDRQAIFCKHGAIFRMRGLSAVLARSYFPYAQTGHSEHEAILCTRETL